MASLAVLAVLAACVTVVLLAAPSTPSVLRPPASPTAVEALSGLGDVLLSDMVAPHERRPHGVPLAYDWASYPRLGTSKRSASYRAFTAWGQLYRCATPASSRAAPVELRDLQTWAFRRSTGKWTRLQSSSDLRGASFSEDFKGPTTAADVVQRSASSTTARWREGYNFHFWPAPGRVDADPQDISAVAVLLRARYAPGSSTRRACSVLSVGGDYWPGVTINGDGPVDAGIGRFKLVRPTWRVFTMTTASPALLARRPLPVRIPPAQLKNGTLGFSALTSTPTS